MKPTKQLLHLILSTVVLGIPSLHALPIITNVAETGGDAEATDTIPAEYSGRTFVNGVANEPVAGKAADAPYTVGLFGEEAPMFVDRNHQWNGATTTLPIPSYLLGGEYIMAGNDNRDNPEYLLEITISKESFVYMLVDDRVGDASNANPPNFPDFTADRTGDGLPDMRWLVDENWEPVKTGYNRFNNPDWPDQVGADEGGNGVGPGGDIQQWSSIYTKRIPAGTFTIRQPDNNGQNMYGVVIKPVPDNPTVVASSGSAFGFRFLVSDGGVTTLATNSVALTLGGTAVSATSITATNKVTTIVYDSPTPLPSESQQTAVLIFADSAGTRFTNTFNFTVERYISLPPSAAVTDVDTSKRGFRVFTHQLETRRHILGDNGNRIPPAEEQLANRLGANMADTTPFSPTGYFVETTYINYNQDSTARDDAASNAGNFSGVTTPSKNEHPIPGIPGTGGILDHAVVEVTAYVELPAGWVTMGVNSDDGFRLTVSLVGALRDKMAPAIAEFDGARGAANTEGRFLVQQAGVYAMRLMWFEGVGGFNVEWYIVQPGGARVLINDPAEATAPKAYYGRTGANLDPTHVSVLDPFPFGSTLALAFPDDPIYIEITDGAVPVDTGSVQLRVNGQATTPVVNKTGGQTTVTLAPPTGVWPAGNLAVELRYGTETHTYTIPVMNYVTLEECLRTATGTGSTPGMNWRTHQLDQTATRANSVAAAEAQLHDPNNAADLSLATAGVFAIDYINFEQGGIADGLIHENQPAPRNAAELPIPGIPGVGTVGNNMDNIVGEATTFVEFPTAGVYYMGINRDDGFLLTVASTEGGRSLTNGPNVQEIGRVEPGGGIDDNNVQNFMAVNVTQPGVWPLRLLWFEGNGGASIEWYQTSKREPIGLVNDPNVTTTLRAFRARTAQPPATNSPACAGTPSTPAISVTREGNNVVIRFDGTLQEADTMPGTFRDVTAASPHTVNTSQAATRFYRSRR